MPSILTLCSGLCLSLGLMGTIAAAESAAPAPTEHTHLRQVPTFSKAGYVTRSVTCTEVHPAPATAPEHTHRWFKAGDKRPGQWITETCTQVHPQTQAKVCPLPSPKGGCAHKPRC